ncbi:DUF6114 domain-containing protein [Streptomyces sp. DT171]|uniref:DUF6114 domain-containing protein n=1 Tax=Streptomyces sp. DT171 TaxID=3416524 RepID=UPI003CEAD861
MSAETTGSRGFAYWRLRFRAWRQTRPFWAGLFTTLGGVPIAYFPYADLKIGHLTLTMATTAGAGSLIIGVLLATLGLTMWYHQIVRVFAGVATILLALVSIPVANFGGFGIGFLLALIGGCLGLAWAPGTPVAERPDEYPAGPGRTDGAGVPPGADDLSYTAGRPAAWSDDDGTSPTADANGGRNSAG